MKLNTILCLLVNNAAHEQASATANELLQLWDFVDSDEKTKQSMEIYQRLSQWLPR